MPRMRAARTRRPWEIVVVCLVMGFLTLGAIGSAASAWRAPSEGIAVTMALQSGPLGFTSRDSEGTPVVVADVATLAAVALSCAALAVGLWRGARLAWYLLLVLAVASIVRLALVLAILGADGLDNLRAGLMDAVAFAATLLLLLLPPSRAFCDAGRGGRPDAKAPGVALLAALGALVFLGAGVDVLVHALSDDIFGVGFRTFAGLLLSVGVPYAFIAWMAWKGGHATREFAACLVLLPCVAGPGFVALIGFTIFGVPVGWAALGTSVAIGVATLVHLALSRGNEAVVPVSGTQ